MDPCAVMQSRRQQLHRHAASRERDTDFVLSHSEPISGVQIVEHRFLRNKRILLSSRHQEKAMCLFEAFQTLSERSLVYERYRRFCHQAFTPNGLGHKDTNIQEGIMVHSGCVNQSDRIGVSGRKLTKLFYECSNQKFRSAPSTSMPR